MEKKNLIIYYCYYYKCFLTKDCLCTAILVPIRIIYRLNYFNKHKVECYLNSFIVMDDFPGAIQQGEARDWFLEILRRLLA